MGIEIPGTILSSQKAPPEFHFPDKNVQNQNSGEEKLADSVTLSEAELQAAMDSLSRTANLFNKRLKFSINEEIGRVVVKVIDTETDKVLKEIPAREMQRLIARLKETIGLLVDEKI